MKKNNKNKKIKYLGGNRYIISGYMFRYRIAFIDMIFS